MEVTAARRSFLCDIGMWADRTALHEAASMGRVLQLSQLIDSGSSVNTVTVDNVTALHEACIKGHPNCVRLLLRAGAQVDVRTIHGSTPLCYACTSGSLDCARLLLEHGANVNPSLTTLTPSSLQEACMQGMRLIEGGASVNMVAVDSITPLHEACLRGQVQCVRLLLEAGAQVRTHKLTPLCDACTSGSLECVRLLLKHGAKTNPALTSRTASPLHEACMGGTAHTSTATAIRIAICIHHCI
uniref:Uncharacterized protein n=1 Tax=Periophthalmus magnuspinnatus TaxID=409849 RepID=A0A3B3ZXV0_9GOBI